MKKITTQNVLLQIITWGVYVILFAPLFVSGEFIFPFVALKVSAFRIVTEIVVGAYVLLLLQSKAYRPRMNAILYAFLAFFVIQIVSSVFGIDLYMSFWSSYERMWGLLTAAHIIGFLIVISSVFTTKEQWLRLFRVSLLVSALVSIYGLLQVFGVQTPTNTGSRIESTIGNAAFLAAYLLFHLFFAAYFFIEDKLHRWKKFYIAVFIIDFVILFYTATRGAFVGLVFGLFTILVYALFQKGSPAIRKKFGIGLAILVILLAGLFALRDTSLIRSVKPLNRITHISLQDGSVLSRLVVWELSFEGVQERPFLGYGEENYDKVFNKHYDSRVTEEWFDRAHNIVLDILVANGVVGLLAYSSIFVAAIWLMRKQREDKILFPVFTGLLIAYVIQNMFVFDTINTIIPFLLTLGFIIFKSVPEKQPEEVISKNTVPIPAILAVIILVAVSSYAFVVKPLRASSLAINGYQWQRANPARTLDLIEQALALGTYGNREIALQMNFIALDVLGNKELITSDKQFFIAETISVLQSVIKNNPQDTRALMALAQLYQLSYQFDPTYLSNSVPVLLQVEELSPGRLEIYYGLAQVAMIQGDFDTAVEHLQRAIEMAPEDGDPYYVLAQLLLQKGDVDLAIEQLTQAESLNYDYKNEQYIKLISLFSKYSRFGQIVKYYELAVEKFPDNPQFWASLADSYLQIGEYAKAREAVERAVDLDQETYGEEALLFLELVNKAEAEATSNQDTN